MTDGLSGKEIHQALAEIKHPEIDSTLIDLGMLKDISIESKKITMTLKLPTMGIPAQIKDYLTNSINLALANLDASLQGTITLAQMSQEELMNFSSMARANWTG